VASTDTSNTTSIIDHTSKQFSVLSRQIRTDITDTTEKALLPIAAECTAAHIDKIVYDNPNLPADDDEYREFKGPPYCNYTKRRGPLLNDLRKVRVGRDPVTRLVFSPLLNHVIPFLLGHLSKHVTEFLEAQQEWLMERLDDCKLTTTANISSSTAQGTARLLSFNRIWETLNKHVANMLHEFTTTALHNVRVYVTTELKGDTNVTIHEEMRTMRNEAVMVKKKRKGHKSVDASRIEVLKEHVAESRDTVVSEILRYLRIYLTDHLQKKYLDTSIAALQEFINWMSQQGNVRSSTHDLHLVKRQVQQFVALDSAEARAGFKYATAVKVPLLLTKLQEVYKGDDAQFLTSVLDDTSNTNDTGAADDSDYDNLPPPPPPPQHYSGHRYSGKCSQDSSSSSSGNISSSNISSSNNSSNSNYKYNSSAPRKRKHSAVASSDTNDYNGESDED
jgi:hypothetical protein